MSNNLFDTVIDDCDALDGLKYEENNYLMGLKLKARVVRHLMPLVIRSTDNFVNF